MFLIAASVLGGVLSIAAVLYVLRMKRHHAAVANVLFAKYTFQTLNKKQQGEVHDKAVSMVLESGVKERGFVNDVERYGWYAQAMRVAGIPSAVPQNPRWKKFRNPYAVVNQRNTLFTTLSAMLKNEYGIDVAIVRTQKNSRDAQEPEDKTS